MALAWDTPRLQRALNYACWYSTNHFIHITGVMDEPTVRSVKEWQRINNRAQTGNVTQELLDSLEAEMNRKRISDLDTDWMGTAPDSPIPT